MTIRPVLQGEPVVDWRWRWDAACVDATPELFDWRHLTSRPPAVVTIVATARLWCRDCPVREACRAEAEQREYVGLWGGVWFNGGNRGHGGSAYDMLTGKRIRAGRRGAA